MNYATFEKSSDEVNSIYLNKQTKEFFSTKYSSNIHIIKQLQMQRKFSQTPLIKARRLIQTLEDGDSVARTSSKQSDRFRTTFQSTMRPLSYNESFQNLTLMSQLDLGAAQIYLQNLFWIYRCLQQLEDTPNFQQYWESLFELKFDSYVTMLRRPQYQDIIKKSIILNDISLAFIQCTLKELFLRNSLKDYKYLQELRTVCKFNLESFSLYLRKLLQLSKQQNNLLLLGLVDKLNKILARFVQSEGFIKEIQKNNQFLLSLLEQLLKQDVPEIQPVIITCRHSLINLKHVEIATNRSQLINAIFLSTQQKNQKVESPLKTLFRQSERAYSQDLREQFAQLDFPKPPFLTRPPNKNYTLVLDLDETLGHFNQKLGRFTQRPGLNEFLQAVSQFYEIIIFTAGLQSYADLAIEQIQAKDTIQYRLYRQHTSLTDHSYIKDLSKIGRELDKLIIIDNSASNFAFQVENGLLVSTWTDNNFDTELVQLTTLLIRIAKSQTSDVRKSLRKYRDYISRFSK